MTAPPRPRAGAPHRARLRRGSQPLHVALLVAVAASTTGEAMESRPAPAATTAPSAVRIGVALNPQRAGMVSIYNGVELAIAALNAQGGEYTFAMRRTDSTATSAITIATELADDVAVVGVVGHPESGATMEALPIYEDRANRGRRAVVAISPTATSPTLSGRSQWFFRVCPSDDAASKAVAQYVADSLGATRAAVVYRNDSYGRDWTRSFAAAFRNRGGTLVQRDPYVTGGTEWEAYAAYMKQQGAEILLFPGSVEDAEQMIRALRAIDARIGFIGGDAASALEDNAGEFAGARYTAFFDPRLASSQQARSFIAAYQRRFGRLPDQRAALAYDAAMLIGQAVAEVGPHRRRVRDWIADVGRSRPAVDGVAGRIAFDENGDAVDKPVVVATVGAR